jgi:hypothetical protein
MATAKKKSKKPAKKSAKKLAKAKPLKKKAAAKKVAKKNAVAKKAAPKKAAKKGAAKKGFAAAAPGSAIKKTIAGNYVLDGSKANLVSADIELKPPVNLTSLQVALKPGNKSAEQKSKSVGSSNQGAPMDLSRFTPVLKAGQRKTITAQFLNAATNPAKFDLVFKFDDGSSQRFAYEIKKTANPVADIIHVTGV